MKDTTGGMAQERRLPWFVPAGLALLVGLFLRDLIDQGTDAPSQVIAAVEPLGTSVVYVNAVLSFPTGTATTLPTARPTDAPTVVPGLNWCSTPVAGKVCEVPPGPTGTATPFPNCADMASLEPKDLCQWR